MKYLVALIILVTFVSPAQARRRRAAPIPQPMCFFFCPPPVAPPAIPARRKAVDAPRLRRHPQSQLTSSASPEWSRPAASEIVENPAGCPRRAFCGCGAAVRVFGKPLESLWAAASWFKFPRTAPAPGMAAVRRHHVMVLESDLGGGIWQVYDANSGGHATRIHAKSIAGYTIVNPHG